MTDLPALVRDCVEANLPDAVDADRLLARAVGRAKVRRTRARVLLAAAASAVLVVAGGLWPGGRDVVVAAFAGAGSIVEIPCPSDVGYCSPTYTFAGQPFSGPTCTAVRADLVTDDVVARGRIVGSRTEVRRIRGVDPALVVAVRTPTTGCEEVAQEPLPWSLAISTSGEAQDAVRLRDVHDAVCAVAVDRDRLRSRCGASDPRPSSLDRVDAPVVLYDPLEWPSRLDDLECLVGTVRFRLVVPGPTGGHPTRDVAAERMETAVLDALSAPGAARTSTVSYREVTRATGRHEELFFRGDGIAVAYGTATQTRDGGWQSSYVGCAPSSAIPAGGVLAQ